MNMMELRMVDMLRILCLDKLDSRRPLMHLVKKLLIAKTILDGGGGGM